MREPARGRRELSGATVLKRGTAFGLAGERPIHWELAEILAACAAAGPDATLARRGEPGGGKSRHMRVDRAANVRFGGTADTTIALRKSSYGPKRTFRDLT